MVRIFPPDGGGADTPGSVANIGLTLKSAASCRSFRPSLGSSLEKTSVPTGTLPASNRITNGGTVPVGMNARERFTYDTVSAIARDMSVPGWNCSLIRAAPWMLLLSTCSMPLT